MRKKYLAFALALCMVLTLLPVTALAAGPGTAEGPMSGDDFIGKADDQGKIKLTGNVTLSSGARVKSKLIIDLDGHTLTRNVGDTENTAVLFIDEGGSLEIQGTAGSTIENTGKDGHVIYINTENTSVTVGENVLIKAEHATDSGMGIEVAQMEGKSGTVTLTINGTVQSGSEAQNYKNGWFAVYGWGNNKLTMKVDVSGKLYGNTAIYAPATNTITVNNNAVIQGYTSGIEIRQGTLTVNGGTIKATTSETGVTVNGGSLNAAVGGCTVSGAAVAVNSDTRDVKVDIKGGTLEGANGLTITDSLSYSNQDEHDLSLKNHGKHMTIDISDSATITGTSGKAVAITPYTSDKVQADESFATNLKRTDSTGLQISGGTFKGGDVATDMKDYIETGKAAHKQADGSSYKVEEKWDAVLSELKVNTDGTVSGEFTNPPADSGSPKDLGEQKVAYADSFTITATFNGEAKYSTESAEAAQNGTALTSKSASAAIAFGAEDTKTVYIYVAADDSEGYYKLTVTRKSNKAAVTAVEGTFGTDKLTGEIGTDNGGSTVEDAIPVTITVPKDTTMTGVTVKLTVDDKNATVTQKNDTAANADSASKISDEASNSDGSVEIQSVDFTSNKFLFVKVVSEDGSKTVIYKITVEQTEYKVEMAATKTDGVDISDGDTKGKVETAVKGTTVTDTASKNTIEQAVISAVEANTSLEGEEGNKLDAEAAKTYLNSQLQEDERDSVNIFAVPYLDIKVDNNGYRTDGDTYTLDVTPRYYVIAAKHDVSDVESAHILGEGGYNSSTANAVKLNTGSEDPKIEGLKDIQVEITLPSGFQDSGDVYVRIGNDKYETKYNSPSGGKITVTFPHFSEVVISKTTSSKAYIETTNTYYDSIQDAINAVTNEGTIKLTNAAVEADLSGLKAPVPETWVEGFKFTFDKGDSALEEQLKTVTLSTTTSGGYIYTAENSGGTVTVTREKAPSAPSGSSSATVNTVSAKNGSFTVSDKNAKAGDTVKITPKANDGYVVDQVTVTDKNGNNITVTQNADGTYSFVMPAKSAQPVDVKVTFKEEGPATGFVDVAESDYFADAVAWAVENGITDGVGNNSFAPNAGCTRAQIVTFLWRAAGSPEPVNSSNPFADVNAGDYYGKAVLWAVEQGITNGTSATEFSPNATCTRAQAVTFLHRYEKQPAASGSSFADVADGAYYESAVDWAVANEITNGTGNNQFSPDDTCTRAQIVTFLYRDMVK